MAKYTVKFYKRTISGADHRVNDEIELILEFENRPFFTSRDFKSVILWLFDLACNGGKDTNRVYAEISRDGREIFYVYANSYEDGPVIDCIVSLSRIGERRYYYRTMNIGR